MAKPIPSVIKSIDPRTDFQKVVDNLKLELSANLELVRITSKIAWEQYTSLKEEGFTEEQAMSIVTTQPSWKG